MSGFVSFLSDYGYADEFAGVCRGVVARLAPEARIVDLTHGIPRHDVRAGAVTLRNALPYLPAGVHLAVVDPEVGKERRAIAALTADEERILVGPDNGLLSLAADAFGGIAAAYDIGRSPWRLEPVSATFHGRDIFAPVAGRLAAGAAIEGAGEPADPASVARIELPAPSRDGDTVVAAALHADRFGNVVLNLDHDAIADSGLRLGGTVTVETGGGTRSARYARTFADVGEGELLLYQDSYRWLALAVNRGSAAEELAIGRDAEVRLAPAP